MLALAALASFSTILGLSCASIAPACDIHTANDGYRSPPQLVPLQAAEPSWLYAPQDEIQAAYRAGKAECEKHLHSDAAFKTEGHAPYYTDNSRIPMGGQKQCRGRAALYDLTGMLVWPFGPIHDCPTYSKCWFGLLTCGTPKLPEIREQALGEISKVTKRFNVTTVPDVSQWSIKAIRIHARITGPEIVVPDQRLLTLSLSQPTPEEVMVLQYHLTIPGNFLIEARQLEFYPAILMPFTAYGLENAGRVFLGGTESRCRAWTKCSLHANCCGCDEKSMVSTTPMAIVAADGSGKCAAVSALPLCPAGDSRHAGRWIHSSNPSLTPRCEAHHNYNLMTETTKAHPLEWKQASGNPCIHVDAGHHEDMGSSSWFYAPYDCKYHFYTRVELHQCFSAQKIHHIHFQGDSMSRDLFATVSKYLGVEMTQEADLKKLTNELKQSNLQYHSGSLLLSEGYSWDWNPEIMRLIEQPPLPDVLIINHAIAHRLDFGILFGQKLNQTEGKYWNEERNHSIAMPKYRIFQNVRDLHGMRNAWFIGNNFRQNNEMLRQMYSGLGFVELDEFLLTTGRFDTSTNTETDGWHFGGSTKQMEAVMLFNMICNDWYKTKG